jgi:ABC-2 type transport system ATP-binding protein
MNQAADRTHELVDSPVWTGGGATIVLHADSDVAVEQAERDLVKRRLHGVELGHDVDAVAILLDHLRDSPDLTLDPGQAVEQLLLACGVAPWRAGCLHALDNTPLGYYCQAMGRDSTAAATRPPGTDAERQRDTVLRVEGIEKSFGRGLPPRRRRVEVLRGAGLEVRRGELVGLVGENGSGKSTLMKIIVGLLERDAGVIERLGKLGYCPQTPLLWEKLTVAEHFELFARAYELDSATAATAGESLLNELQFSQYNDYRIEDLSGGTRQKLNLALALMHEPDLLLLDEPYSGFDWETYLRFWEMSERRRDNGMSILIVSHFLSERERLDRVYELREGRCRET